MTKGNIVLILINNNLFLFIILLGSLLNRKREYEHRKSYTDLKFKKFVSNLENSLISSNTIKSKEILSNTDDHSTSSIEYIKTNGFKSYLYLNALIVYKIGVWFY